jgi:hypothetical protein
MTYVSLTGNVLKQMNKGSNMHFEHPSRRLSTFHSPLLAFIIEPGSWGRQSIGMGIKVPRKTQAHLACLPQWETPATLPKGWSMKPRSGRIWDKLANSVQHPYCTSTTTVNHWETTRNPISSLYNLYILRWINNIEERERVKDNVGVLWLILLNQWWWNHWLWVPRVLNSGFTLKRLG